MYFPFTIVLVQTYDKARNALALALSPVVRALVDPDGAMRDIRNLDSVRIISCYCYFGFIPYYESVASLFSLQEFLNFLIIFSFL